MSVKRAGLNGKPKKITKSGSAHSKAYRNLLGELSMTEQQKTDMEALLRVGHTIASAAKYVNVSSTTLSKVRQVDKRFNLRLFKAQENLKGDLLHFIHKAAEGDWKAAAWLLERKFWTEWGKRSPTMIPRDEMIKLFSQLMEIVLAPIPPGEVRDQVLLKWKEIVLQLSAKKVRRNARSPVGSDT